MICPSCQAENPPGAEVCFHCRAILAAITRGTVVAARYEVLRPLGRGGMGTVYEAHDRVLDEPVALKVLRSDLVQAPGMADRFRSEIKLARRVGHPNVCRIHEYGEDGSVHFISMELVRGTNLKEVLRRRGALPAGEALDVALQAARGLDAIHEAGIVHRDLKPQNLTIDGTGRVRVMDFGIAIHAAEGTTGPTGSGYVVGSPEYMSPEQARGRALDARSDVYALGVVLFELVTGRVPFRGETPVATLLLHLEAPPPLEGSPEISVPAAIVPVLRRALAKDPRDRFASAREMGDALYAARGGTAGAGSADRARWPRAVLPIAAAIAGLAVAQAFVASRPGAGIPPTATPIPRTAPASTLELPPPSPPAPLRPEPGARSRVPSPGMSAPIRAQSERTAEALPSSAPPPTSLATPDPTPTAPAAGPADTATAVEAAPATAPKGALLVLVTPWADVSVDGAVVGQTPLARIPLPPGPHSVLLSHPDYQPFPRKITVAPGETFRLVVDLATDGVRRRP